MKKPRLWLILLAPVAGGFSTATYLTLRGLFGSPSFNGRYNEAMASFGVWGLVHSLVLLALGLPLLVIARRLGLKHRLGFMILAALSMVPYAAFTANPSNAWSPTATELDHGFYWDAFLPVVLLASVMGWWYDFHTHEVRETP